MIFHSFPVSSEIWQALFQSYFQDKFPGIHSVHLIKRTVHKTSQEGKMKFVIVLYKVYVQNAVEHSDFCLEFLGNHNSKLQEFTEPTSLKFPLSNL